MKVIFLDFDGVLNGYDKRTENIYKVLKILHLYEFFNKHYDIFGIRIFKVFLLKILCLKTDSYVVLSSSWRNAYFMDYKEVGDRGKKLQRIFKFFRIPVIGKTRHLDGSYRGKEILDYLLLHPEVKKFVILDDENFDIKKLFPKELVLTSTNGELTSTYIDKTGLKIKHIKQAIKILKEEQIC